MACPLTRFTLKALNRFAMRKLCLSFLSPSQQPDQMENPLSRSSEGHELQFATNHLGPFLLTKLLLPLLRKAPAARYVNGMKRRGKERYGMVYLSIFLLTKLPLPLLRKAPAARYPYVYFLCSYRPCGRQCHVLPFGEPEASGYKSEVNILLSIR